MAASPAAETGISAVAVVEEPTDVEELSAVEEEVTAVEEQSYGRSRKALKIRKHKKSTSKKEKQQPEMHRGSLRPLQRESLREDEPQTARLMRRHRRNSFAIYFPKVLKNVHVGFTLSQRSVSILDSFVKDMFERIATEASNLARLNRSSTINSREIQTAIRLLLPGEICKRAITEGTMALVRYITRK